MPRENQDMRAGIPQACQYKPILMLNALCASICRGACAGPDSTLDGSTFTFHRGEKDGVEPGWAPGKLNRVAELA